MAFKTKVLNSSEVGPCSNLGLRIHASQIPLHRRDKKGQKRNIYLEPLKAIICFKNFCFGQRFRTFVQKFLK